MSAVNQRVTRTNAKDTPLQLTPHFLLQEFTRSETAARRGIRNVPGQVEMQNLFKLAALLEQVRSLCGGKVVHISSGLRVHELNVAVGGAKNSDHKTGSAADFTIPRFGTPLEVCRAIAASNIPFGQLIWEGNWVHISLGTKREVLTAHFVPGKKTHYTRGLP